MKLPLKLFDRIVVQQSSKMIILYPITRGMLIQIFCIMAVIFNCMSGLVKNVTIRETVL